MKLGIGYFVYADLVFSSFAFGIGPIYKEHKQNIFIWFNMLRPFILIHRWLTAAAYGVFICGSCSEQLMAFLKMSAARSSLCNF